MECSVNLKVTKEEVIAKLKDDGDFDSLRRKIIQKLKNNEELRENIFSIVKQSEALNGPGAENMKPRQLSDDIYQEVGEKVITQISDGLWGIIRSSDDGMKSEITKTVQSVYNKLANPGEYAEVGSSAVDVAQVLVDSNNNGVVIVSANGSVDGVVVDNEPNVPPGFSLSYNNEETSNHEPSPSGKGAMTELQEGTHQLQDKMETEAVNHVEAQEFSADKEHKQECDGSDEDPDVPPGFG